MKKKSTSIACGLSAVSLLAFALVACDSESPSAAPCNCNVPSSSSCEGVPESSSDEMQPVSSSSVEEQPESSSTEELPTSSSDVVESSSSETVASSSSVIASSSSWNVGCITMSNLCPTCDDDYCPIPFMPCNQCYGMYGAETYDCETNERYVCSKFDTWDRTCLNLTDSSGNIAEDTCEYGFGAWLDCNTDKPYVCKEGRWERLPEEYSWVHQKCDSSETSRSVSIEFDTEKGSTVNVRLGFYCNGIYWQQSATSTPERGRCEIEEDKVTISEKTYQCIGGSWDVF